MLIIAGEARGRQIAAPEGRNTRPTLDRVRENIFNMLQADVPGSRVLDLFAGSGALSLEALSRGAVSAVLVDSDRKANMVQKKNAETLRYTDRTRILLSDWKKAVRVLQEEQQVFDLVFLDPPYCMTDLRDVFASLIPLSGPETLIVLEHESGKDVTADERFETIRQKEWGFCAVSFYRLRV